MSPSVGTCLIQLPVPVPKGHQTPPIGRVVMLECVLEVQTLSMILALSQLSGVNHRTLV